jgi:hypothetical protein
MTNPNHITRQQLADLIGARAPSYINELEKNGRAVRAPDGKLWLKAESLAAYRAGKDPSKQGVADRHAAARAASLQTEQEQNKAVAPVNIERTATESIAHSDAGQDDAPGGNYSYQLSKAKREHFAAMEAEASYRKLVNELLEASEVRSVLNEVVTVLRTSIEGIPYNLAPMLAATNDEAVIKSTLAAEVEHALKTASEALAKLGRGEF